LLGGLAASFGTAALPPFAVADPAATSEPVSFGVFPYLPALEIGRQFGPMATAFSEIVGRPVSLQTKSDFPTFLAAVYGTQYDIALLHPFIYCELEEIHDYHPLARLQSDLAGVVVAPVDRPMASFADLRGATLAVPPKLSAVARLVEVELRRAELDGPDGVGLVYHRTKTACVHSIMTGQATACVIPGFFLDQLRVPPHLTLEAKFETRSIPGILFAGHGRLGNDRLYRLEQAMLGWDTTPEGRQLLADLGWSSLAPVRPGEYDIAALRLRME
jgi:ABC-type phosphate/phosphonate transport system substrate-binding protein